MTNPRYSPELRERAVRMVIEKRDDYKSEWAAVSGVATLLGMSPETLRTWLRRTRMAIPGVPVHPFRLNPYGNAGMRTQIDEGNRPGLTTDERVRLKQLERENKDPRRANAILKDASIFFATELDGHTKR